MTKVELQLLEHEESRKLDASDLESVECLPAELSLLPKIAAEIVK